MSQRLIFFVRFLVLYLVWHYLINPHALGPAVDAVLARFQLHDDDAAHILSAPAQIVFDTIWFCFVLAWSAIVILTERRPAGMSYTALILSRCQLAGGRSWSTCFPMGVLLGAGIAITIIGAMVAAGALRAHLNLNQGTASLAQGQALLLLASFLPAIAEETYFRGYGQYALTRSLSFWPATFLTSYWFAHGHFGEGDPLIGAIGAGEWAIFSCLAIRLTGNLALSIGFHGAWNYVENALFGTLDSGFTFRESLVHTLPHGPTWLTGGSAGPEGSMLFLASNAVLIVGILFWGRRHKAPKESMLMGDPSARRLAS